jgi:hypothetical protein
MTPKTLVFRPGLTLSLALAGVALTVGACGSDAANGNNAMTTSAASTTTAPVTATSTDTTTSGAPSTTTPAVTPTVEPTTSTAAPTTSTTSASSSSTSETTSEGPTGASSGADDSSSGEDTGASGASGASSAPADSSAGEDTGGVPAADDLDMTAEQFSCIGEWDAVLGFRIQNLLGHLEEAKAVANNPAGGVYPVGTILQHFPTEAMVKRKAGYSPETKDWEFFLLTLNQDGTTTIASRGPDITTMGQTCASCHVKADAAFDFVCNTWAEHGGAGNCGFELGAAQLDGPIAMDPRCN